MISDMKDLCPHFGRIVDLLMGAFHNPRESSCLPTEARSTLLYRRLRFAIS